MMRGELADAIEAGGVKMPSKDKPRYLGTVLWRERERFVNLEGHGYWLVGLDGPEVGYVAQKDPHAIGTTEPSPEDREAAENRIIRGHEVASIGRLDGRPYRERQDGKNYHGDASPCRLRSAVVRRFLVSTRHNQGS